MNVLHLVRGRSFTGAASAALTDVRALLAAGHRAWLGGPAGGGLERECARQGLPFVAALPDGDQRVPLLRLPSAGQRLSGLLTQHGIDVLHVHRSDEQWLAQWAHKRGQRPALVRTWHRNPAEKGALLLRQALRGCAACCCVARAHEYALRASGMACARFLPPGVDTEKYRPVPRPPASVTANGNSAPEPAPRPLVLGIIGRWKKGEDRGQRAFLRVMQRLSQKHPWRGVLLGRGEDRPALEKLIAVHPSADRLALLETGEDYPAQVAALDLGLVFAVGADGTSRPAAEMLACGVPLLVADRPGLRELGEGSGAVRILPESQYGVWAGEIERLLADRAALAAASAAARAQAETVHALRVRGAALAALYQEALGAES